MVTTLLAGVGLAIVGEADTAAAYGGIRADAVPAYLIPWYTRAARQCSGITPALLAAQGYQESRFNPRAVSPKGAAGIAQFMPTTWARWGRDDDGNGVSSPFDVGDAIMAQGRLMCALLDKAAASGYPGDPIALALAGYNAGWGAVELYRRVPPYPETQNYVAEITRRAREWATPGGTIAGSGGTFHDGTHRIAIPRANPRSTRAAIAWARQQAGTYGWFRRCLNFTARAYGWQRAGVDYAIDHYYVVPARMRHDGDRNPPPGALLYWRIPGQRAGHVSIYLGDGLIASNDILAKGRIDIVPADLIEKKWGARYVGWTVPYFPHAVR
ncbi:lytic transglycosylase domain-containing protein [Carbonactinospora thermoautotrophica]|uniref:lytic transglycosylase domain-containing protein n=1 Tax=Carbonactinospora thermoautotrophica TaxID=1469144 RepID=UPI001FD41214|nr:lytic transglycosylase domain-containing protein [Carbonactinospora thermoautotrophica]